MRYVAQIPAVNVQHPTLVCSTAENVPYISGMMRSAGHQHDVSVRPARRAPTKCHPAEKVLM